MLSANLQTVACPLFVAAIKKGIWLLTLTISHAATISLLPPHDLYFHAHIDPSL
jgi:hypothetical protein